MYLYIIRHGETYGNINGDGFTETDLTDNGLQQAFLLGERFKNEKIDAIFVNFDTVFPMAVVQSKKETRQEEEK